MSLTTAPTAATPAPVPYSVHERVCRERDQLQHKLSAVTAALQNPALTWKQRGARIAVALALEAQRPADNPNGAFRADLGGLAKRAGLIPPTPEGDEEARSKGWKSGRKLAGQVLKEFAELGVLAEHSVEKERDTHGSVIGAGVVVQIDRPHVEVIRAASLAGGTRKLQAPRGRTRPVCPDCGPMAPVIERRTVQCYCGQCGQALTDPDVQKRRMDEREFGALDDPSVSAGFQRLETRSTENTAGVERSESDGAPEFQTLETGNLAPPAGVSEERPPEKPAYLAPDPVGIPTALIGRRQWVCWRAVLRDGKWTKVPIDPKTGEPASCTDARTWATMAQALARYRAGTADGVGFVFTPDDPFVGVDFDALDEEARRDIAELGSYTETSVTGRGAHVIVAATKPTGGCRTGTVEMYDHGRYFCMTGRRIEGTPATIERRQEELARIHARRFPKREPSAPRHCVAPTPDLEALRDRACRESVRHSIPFEPLWRGSASSVGDDMSRADYWFCRHLAWHGADAGQIDRLWRQSGRASADRVKKWDAVHNGHGETYGDMTIAAAMKDARGRSYDA